MIWSSLISMLDRDRHPGSRETPDGRGHDRQDPEPEGQTRLRRVLPAEGSRPLPKTVELHRPPGQQRYHQPGVDGSLRDRIRGQNARAGHVLRAV